MSDVQTGGSAAPSLMPAVCTCPACLSPFIPNHRREADAGTLQCPAVDADAIEEVHAWGRAC